MFTPVSMRSANTYKTVGLETSVSGASVCEREDFIEAAGAVPYPVLPYVYVSEADDARVLAIINDMAAGQFDAIAFTSAPQVRRLRDVARATGRDADLLEGFGRIVVAAVGPVFVVRGMAAHPQASQGAGCGYSGA